MSGRKVVNKMEGKLGIHEGLELHELMTFKNLCVTKSTVMMGLVNDQELRSLLQQDIQAGTRSIQQIQSLIQQ